MQATFLLGPAGSGKTYRCLAEIRAELSAWPEGPPLLLLAPKQATFQLERQLLADSSLAGYTRLQIVAFDRLAEFILGELGETPPRILSEEGRIMVLRAILARHHKELRIFRSTARLPGFAQQLSLLLREVQQHRLSPAKLAELAAKVPAEGRLGDKLHDIGIILRAYSDWLKQHKLNDVSALLDLASDALKQAAREAGGTFQLGGLWMDGFAEMTPQELHLLATFLPLCEHATLAFCLDGEPKESPQTWLNQWSVIAQTYKRCRNRLQGDEEIEVKVECLPRVRERSRFQESPSLFHLETNWTAPQESEEWQFAGDWVRLVECFDAEAEVLYAVRTIHQHVRAGGRYRDVAVLMRRIEGYQDIIQRVFNRHGIPYFLDRRESVAHHPLAELTRSALRMAAFGWRNEDWFAALKCGLVTEDDSLVDELENQALARGWEGNRWREPLVIEREPGLTNRLEFFRQKIAPPFIRFVDEMNHAEGINGQTLSRLIRNLWVDLEVTKVLEEWSRHPDPQHPEFAAIHQTVWEQLNEWDESLQLAFETDILSTRDWLAVVDSGLAGLTIGVIPPALDQVTIGAIDRSRNPDLQVAIVLGVNEGVFPAPPEAPVILTEVDRKVLAELKDDPQQIGMTSQQRLAHERFFGYIAFTRARQKLIVCWSRQNQKGTALNPSPFITQLEQLFPNDGRIDFNGTLKPEDVQTLPELLSLPNWAKSAHKVEAAHEGQVFWNPVSTLVKQLERIEGALKQQQLSAAAVTKLYGDELPGSVSSLENYAACPFRFFVGHGLSAEERKAFEVDVRQEGSLRHDILDRFHKTVQEQDRRWRDLTPTEAGNLIRQIGEEVLPKFAEGLFVHDRQREFHGRMLIRLLERMMSVLIGWMEHYNFDPKAVEFAFGMKGDGPKGWRLELPDGRALVLRGRIDRIDLCIREGKDEALVAVFDYKSSSKSLDDVKLQHGLQLQLLAYLAFLKQSPEARALLGAKQLIPAGAFFINLRSDSSSSASREEAKETAEEKNRKVHRHTGRFDVRYVDELDTRGTGRKEADQFKSTSRSADGQDGAEFETLLQSIEQQLRQIGVNIFAGDVSVSPYRYKKECACERCVYQGICRFEETHSEYRVLHAAKKAKEDKA
ncbi:MAG TPA: PD-(D/E)XK nuclease family protein [Verrucomicrobiae bacterium]